MPTRKTRHHQGTPALVLLSARGIPHTIHEFASESEGPDDHVDYGLEAAAALGVDPSAVFKTLVWTRDTSQAPATFLALVPVNARVSAKLLASVAGVKKVSLATREIAERLSGSVVGAICPLGMRHTLPVVIDSSARDVEQLFVSAGRRGLEICLNPEDLIEATNATVASIATS